MDSWGSSSLLPRLHHTQVYLQRLPGCPSPLLTLSPQLSADHIMNPGLDRGHLRETGVIHSNGREPFVLTHPSSLLALASSLREGRGPSTRTATCENGSGQGAQAAMSGPSESCNRHVDTSPDHLSPSSPEHFTRNSTSKHAEI